MASKIVSAIVFVFNLIAFGLAVAAEQKRSTVSLNYLNASLWWGMQAKVVQDTEVQYNYCVYDSDRATGYGVGAFLFSLASQLLIMLVSRCFCCGKPLKPGGSRALALVLFIVSWMFFLVAEICLLAGSVENAYHTKYRTMFMDNPPDCQTLRKGVFAAGASFVFFNAIVSQFYYFFYSSAAEASLSPY